MSPKLIVVFGATGGQGSSVVSSFLSEPGWRVRGVTRNTESSASQKLAARGVEMVKADVDDRASLPLAVEGANAVFAVTDFWSPIRDPANQSKVKPGQTINEWGYHNELQQAKNIMDAVAKVEPLERFVWSGLSAAKKWSKGKYTWIYHFDGKADATEYVKQTYPALWKLTSVIQVGAYLENHLRLPGFVPQKAKDGIFEITLPSGSGGKFPYISAEVDTGVFVRALVAEVPAGKNLLAYREMLSVEEFLSLWSTLNNVPARYVEIPFEEYIKAGNDAREAAETGTYVTEFGYEGREDPTVVYPQNVSYFHCYRSKRVFADCICPEARNQPLLRQRGGLDQTARLVEGSELAGEVMVQADTRPEDRSLFFSTMSITWSFDTVWERIDRILPILAVICFIERAHYHSRPDQCMVCG
jgi:NmrA-like family